MKAEVQGAIIDGVKGIAYPKPAKVLKYAQLGSLLLGEKRCSVKQIQIVAGGLVYMSMFRRPLLGSLNAVWRFVQEFKHYPPVIKLEIPHEVKLEIARFIALVPLAQMDFRLEVSAEVTAATLLPVEEGSPGALVLQALVKQQPELVCVGMLRNHLTCVRSSPWGSLMGLAH